MYKITCNNCEKTFKVKLISYGCRTRCPYCNCIIDFCQIRGIVVLNYIFTLLMVGGALLTLSFFRSITELPYWVAFFAVLITFIIIFIPTLKILTCYLYNKVNKQN